MLHKNVIHEFIEIFDKNIASFPPSPINNKLKCFSSQHFLIHKLDVFPYFHNQKH